MFKAASIVILLLTLTLLIPAHSFMVALNVQNKRLNMSRSGKSGGGWIRRAGKGNGLENAKGQRKELDSCADDQHVIPFKSKWPRTTGNVYGGARSNNSSSSGQSHSNIM